MLAHYSSHCTSFYIFACKSKSLKFECQFGCRLQVRICIERTAAIYWNTHKLYAVEETDWVSRIEEKATLRNNPKPKSNASKYRWNLFTRNLESLFLPRACICYLPINRMRKFRTHANIISNNISFAWCQMNCYPNCINFRGSSTSFNRLIRKSTIFPFVTVHFMCCIWVRIMSAFEKEFCRLYFFFSCLSIHSLSHSTQIRQMTKINVHN